MSVTEANTEVMWHYLPCLYQALQTAVQIEMAQWKPSEGPSIQQFYRARIIGRILLSLDKMRFKLEKQEKENASFIDLVP